MNRKTAAILLCFFVGSGCAGNHLKSGIALHRAESMVQEARQAAMSGQIPVSDPYVIACDYYFQAYQKDYKAFGLNNIENAIEACLSSQRYSLASTFVHLKEHYQSTHRESDNRVPEWMTAPGQALDRIEKKRPEVETETPSPKINRPAGPPTTGRKPLFG